MSTTREHIERQKERLEYIKKDTRQYEEKIAEMLRKIERFEADLFSGTSQGRQIPALVRENIGISVEVQFLEYEKDMRQTMNIGSSSSTVHPQPPFRPSNPVSLDTSGYPYAMVVPTHQNYLPQTRPNVLPYPLTPSTSGSQQSLTPSSGSPNHGQYLSPTPTSHHLGHPTPSHSPSTPTNIVFQSSPNTMVSSTGEIFNITHQGSLNQVVIQPGSGHPSPVPAPERPNCLPLRPQKFMPTRKAPPPPTMMPSISVPSGSQDGDDGRKWACPSCSYENHSALIYCEICENGRSAPRIGNIYTTFSSLYPKESSPLSSSSGSLQPPTPGSSGGAGSNLSSPKSPLVPPPSLPEHPSASPMLGSLPSYKRHKSRTHLPLFGKNRHSKHKDKKGDKS